MFLAHSRRARFANPLTTVCLPWLVCVLGLGSFGAALGAPEGGRNAQPHGGNPQNGIVPVQLPDRGPLPPIDRQALVTRHNPVLREFDTWNPLTVGNGEFAFTADATGLQTFADAFTDTVPLGTLSQWGWHRFPNPEGWSLERFRFSEFDVFRAQSRLRRYSGQPANRGNQMAAGQPAPAASGPNRFYTGQNQRSPRADK
jgi:hypothetical protein